MDLRSEDPGDTPAIRELLISAFPTAAESKLVELLRESGNLTIALTASIDAKVVGHIALSPVTLNDEPLGLGLAPVAVLPQFQSLGYGASLVRAGLERARELGVPLVVVLGETAYYGRFGFEPASKLKLQDEYSGGDAFQALELIAGSTPPRGGLVKYGREFNVV